MRLPVLGRRRCLRSVLGVLLLPPAFWGVFVACVPTECARQCVADRLSAASGRKVRLGRLRVGFLGDVRLTDLRIAAPDSHDDPWLRLAGATIDVSPWQLLFGRVEPTRIEARGLSLRVLRRRDGTLELSDFLQNTRGPQDPYADGGDGGEPTGLTVLLRDASVTVIDEPTGTRLEFLGVKGRAVCRGRQARIPEASGTVNGGRFEFAGQIDRTGSAPAFEGQLKARDVALGGGMNALAYLVPALCGSTDRAEGRLALDLYVRGQGETREAIRKSLVGLGRIDLDPVRLDGSRLLEEVARVVDLPSEGRVGSVRAGLTIRNGRVATDDLTLDVAWVPIVLSGSTDFEGRADYRLKAEGLAERLPSSARELLAEMAIDASDLAEVHVRGTVDALEVTVDGVALGTPVKGGGSPVDDQGRVREVGRRLLEKIRR